MATAMAKTAKRTLLQCAVDPLVLHKDGECDSFQRMGLVLYYVILELLYL